MNEPSFEEKRNFYRTYLSTGHLGANIKQKFALISLLCYLKYKFSKEKPGVTYYKLIKAIDESVPDEFAETLSILCEDFGYACSEFPTFNLTDKEIPKSIREILQNLCPF